jgi:hypothetical protein
MAVQLSEFLGRCDGQNLFKMKSPEGSPMNDDQRKRNRSIVKMKEGKARAGDAATRFGIPQGM